MFSTDQQRIIARLHTKGVHQEVFDERKLPYGEDDECLHRLPAFGAASVLSIDPGFGVTFSPPRRMKALDDIQPLERRRLRARLMERLQQGDADACKELFDSIGPSLTYFLRRRVADPQELEDVYQEVFMAIFEARHTYEPGRPFEPWLFAIARNIAADYTRRRWRRAHWEELVAEPPDQPFETSNAAVPELRSFLAELPPDQREAFSMLKLDGLSVQAAAARVGVSVGALKVRAHRAYKSLKRLITG
jgi:RNA polymerase sigma-70 factor, ECF subfamily